MYMAFSCLIRISPVVQEGLITTAVGLLSFIVMPTNPANAKFLRTARERELAVSRLQSEYGDTDKAQKATDWRLIKRGFFNIHVGLIVSLMILLLIFEP